jgi:hypothetical protein
MKRLVLAIVLTLASAQAWAGNYLLVCQVASCTMSDGTTLAQGAAERISYDGVTYYLPPAGTTLIADDNRSAATLGAANQVPPTAITAEAMLARFAPAEQQAIMTAAQTNWQLGLWLTKFNSSGMIDVTDGRVVSGFAYLVSLNLVTQDRSTQILNLAVASP